MSTVSVIECSGCFIVAGIEFAGNGRDGDKTRAEQYAAWLNGDQSMAGFFSLAEVREQQHAQKIYPYGSAEHKAAYLRMCELALPSPQARKQLSAATHFGTHSAWVKASELTEK